MGEGREKCKRGCANDDIPRIGAPSMISNLVIVSLSLYWFGGDTVVSRRMMESSMCLILMRTSRK